MQMHARQRFFLAAPEMGRLSAEFKDQYGIHASQNQGHPDVNASSIQKEFEAVEKIKATVLAHGNPFASEDDKLFNFITQAYIPQKYVKQILEADQHGQELYETHVNERINGDVNLWAPMKKEKNLMFISGNKEKSVSTRDQTVDLKETKDLYGHLIVLAWSNRDVDQKKAIGTYEFTLTPRAFFAPDGSLLPCNDKSKLINCPQTLVESTQAEEPNAVCPPPSTKIAIVDAMVVVNKLTTKPATVKTVKDLGKYIKDRIMSLTSGYDEVFVVFDTYKDGSVK